MSKIISVGHLKDRIVFLSVLIFCLFYFNHAVASHLAISEKRYSERHYLDTIPVMSKQSMKIHKIENEQEVKMSFEDGILVELEVDGKVIPKEKYGEYEDIIDSSRSQTQSSLSGQMFMFGDNFSNDEFLYKWGDLDSLFDKFSNSGIGMFRKFDEWDGFEDIDADFLSGPMEMLKKIFEDDNFSTFNIDTSFNFQFKNYGQSMPLDDYLLDEEPTDKNNFVEILGHSLNKDELLIPNKTNKIELTGKYLRINGERQPNNIWNKYKRIFEEASGSTLQKNSRIVFELEGKEPKRKYRSF